MSNITNSLPKITRAIWTTATAKKIKEVMVSVVFLLTSPSIPPTDKPPNLAGLLNLTDESGVHEGDTT
jgi:hypothetical protein